MYYEIEKDIVIMEEEQEIREKYTVIFTSLDGNFAVSRYTLYGEEVLKEPLPYSISEDFLNILGDNVPNVNTFYYVHREHGDRLTDNFTVWQNGQKVYENLSESYQIRGEENVGDVKNYTDKEKFPVHPIEERIIEEKEDYIIRLDGSHYYVRRKNIIPFSTDAITFSYDIPNDQVFPGYDKIKEISQQEYNERKSDVEGIYNSGENVFKVKETGEYYHLSSNGERVVETNLPFYKAYIPSFSASNSFSEDYNDHYNAAFNRYNRVGRETLTILPIPRTSSNMYQFTTGIGSNSSPTNVNYSYFKSLKGMRDFRVYSTNTYLGLIRWWNLFDGGPHNSAITSGAYYNGYSALSGYSSSPRTFEGVLPEYFAYSNHQHSIF